MRTSIAILAGSVVLSGCYALTKSEQYYGIETAGKNVLFVLDMSGSMEGKQEGSLQDKAVGEVVERGESVISKSVGGRVGDLLGNQAGKEATKFGAARRELIPAIRGLGPDSHFNLLTFGEQVESWKADMVEATTSNKNLVIAHLATLSADGATPALAALEHAFGYADADVIFFVSDGQPTDADTDQILKRVGGLNADRRMAIYTVGLGQDQDAAFLSALAVRNGGSYERK